MPRPTNTARDAQASRVARRRLDRTLRKGQRKKKKEPPTKNWNNTGRRHSQLGKHYPAEVLTEDEMRQLIKAACPTKRRVEKRPSTGLRNQALVALLYRCGLRIGEALAVREKDLDREAGSVNVLHGKGDKQRFAGGLDPGALAVLDLWLGRRRELGLAKNGTPVFCTLDGKPLSQVYVRQLMPRLARRAGITKRVHAHGIRHTHATELVESGEPLTGIRDQLGHTSVATTDRYLARVAPQERLARLRQREWTL